MKNALHAFLILSLCSAAAAGPLEQLRRGRELPSAPAPGPAAEEAAAYLQDDSRYWITTPAEDKYDRTALLEAGLDIVEIGKKTVSGFISKDEMDRLAGKGFIIRSRQTIKEYAKKHLKDFPASDAAYHNYAETAELLQTLAADNPEETSLFSIGKTVEGRDIWCLRINSGAKGTAASAKPGALYIGNHHAREHLSNEVPLLFAAWLLEHKGDADIKNYIAKLDIYIIPMLNPDGVVPPEEYEH